MDFLSSASTSLLRPSLPERPIASMFRRVAWGLPSWSVLCSNPRALSEGGDEEKEMRQRRW